MSFDVVVVGSFNVDFTCIVDSLPSKGETKLTSECTTACGGKGANQCTQAARLGARTVLICRVGPDSFGLHVKKLCNIENITPSGILTDHDTPTAMAHIFVDSQGENFIVVSTGANYKLSVKDIQGKEEVIKKSKVMVCQNEIREEVTIAALRIAKENGKITIMNAAPAREDFNKEIFTLSDYFIVNKFEASQITKMKVSTITESENAAKEILKMGCKSVIITMGEDGLIYHEEKEHLYIPAPKTEVVDSTGAGDSFVGALAFYLSQLPEKKIEDILTNSCFIASESVRKVGAQGGMLHGKDIPSVLLY